MADIDRPTKDSVNTGKPRVLILAYACSPDRGSESAVGWNRALQAAKQFDTTVLCEENEFGPEITRYLEQNGEISNLSFEYVPLTARERKIGDKPALWYWALNQWHHRAFEVASRLHAERRFDLVHQLTFCGYREPGYLWKLDAPFVWGPVGGTQNYPWHLLGTDGLKGAAKELFRSTVNSFQLNCSRRVRQAARSAATIVAANSTNQRDLGRLAGRQPILLSDVGIETVLNSALEPRIDDGSLRILWSGNLETWKAPALLLHAAAALKNEVPVEIRFLGRGSLEGRCRRLAAQLGIESSVTFAGFMPRAEALRQYDWADVFAFTSLRDTTGTVVVEALANAVPVVACDHQGVRDVVTNDCGIRVPIGSRSEIVAGFADAFRKLHQDRTSLYRMQIAALDRARDYLWTRQGERMAEIYRSVLEQRPVDLTLTGSQRNQSAETRVVVNV